MHQTTPEPINSVPNPNCMMCDSKGMVLYKDMHDYIWGAQGSWSIKKCARCGILWLDPIPLENELHKAYESYYTHRVVYHNRSGNVKAYFRNSYFGTFYHYPLKMNVMNKVVAHLIALLPIIRANLDYSICYLQAKEGGKVLDIGCGNGDKLLKLQALGWEVEGLDSDEMAVKAAKDRNLNVHCGRLQDQQFRSHTFDAVVMCHVLEHLYWPEKELSEVFRILKRRGKLIILTPNANSFGHKIFSRYWRGLEPPRHLHIFNNFALTGLAKKAGFRNIKCLTTIGNSNVIFIASRCLQLFKGKYREGDTQPILIRLLANFLVVLEGILVKLNFPVGEISCLIAEK